LQSQARSRERNGRRRLRGRHRGALAAAAIGVIFWLLQRFYFVWRKIDGLGLGDVKFLAAADMGRLRRNSVAAVDRAVTALRRLGACVGRDRP